MTELKIVIGQLHHQVVADCPKCKEMVVEDLGESSYFDEMEITCPNCNEVFILKDKRAE